MHNPPPTSLSDSEMLDLIGRCSCASIVEGNTRPSQAAVSVLGTYGISTALEDRIFASPTLNPIIVAWKLSQLVGFLESDDASDWARSLARRVLEDISGMASRHIAALEPSANPDTELLRAYADWIEASRVRDSLPDDWKDEAYEPYDRVVIEALERLHRIPATTPQGVAAKLRWFWAATGESCDHYNAVVNGTAVTDEVLGDWRYRLGWNLIQDIERMAGDTRKAQVPHA